MKQPIRPRKQSYKAINESVWFLEGDNKTRGVGNMGVQMSKVGEEWAVQEIYRPFRHLHREDERPFGVCVHTVETGHCLQPQT